MSLTKWVKSWTVNVISRNDVEDDVDDIIKILDTIAIPSYTAANDIFKGYGFQSKYCKDFQKTFSKHVDTSLRGNYIEVTLELLIRCRDALSKLRAVQSNTSGKNIVSKSVTYQQANILGYISIAEFATKYSRLLLIRTMAEDTSAYRNKEHRLLSNAQIMWLDNNEMTYFKVLSVINTPVRDIVKATAKIPTVYVSDDAENEITLKEGLTAIDPLGLRRIRIPNPFRYARLVIAEYRVARYDSAKHDFKMITLELKNLENARAGNNDPALEKQIELYREQAQILHRKITEFEEDVNGSR